MKITVTIVRKDNTWFSFVSTKQALSAKTGHSPAFRQKGLYLQKLPILFSIQLVHNLSDQLCSSCNPKKGGVDH